jgi:hypothetical protein
MPLTRFGICNNPSTPVMRLAQSRRVHPGGELTWTLAPSWVADMTLVGHYTITVSPDIALPGGLTRLVSNPVVVSVGDWYLSGL